MEYDNVFHAMKYDQIPYVAKSPNVQKSFPSPLRSIHIAELKDLCLKSNYKDKSFLFYKALLYYDIITYESIINPSVPVDHDILIYNAFYLGIKFSQNQINLPRIAQIKHMNKKLDAIHSDSFIMNEMLCVQLLNFHMVYSTPYDFIIMFLNGKGQLFEKAKENLDKIVDNRIYVNHSAYTIVSCIITYTLNTLGLRDQKIIKTFYVDKDSACYQTIRNLIITIKEKTMSTNSTIASVSSNASARSINTSICSSNESGKDIIVEKYKKMRQMSKNIELSKTKEYTQINESLRFDQDFLKEEKTNIQKKNYVPKGKQSSNQDDIRNEKESVKRFLFHKEQARRSCINIFSTTMSSKNVIKGCGTINLCTQNQENSYIQPSYPISSFSDKKVSYQLNIDLQSLTKLNLNQMNNLHLKKKINKVYN